MKQIIKMPLHFETTCHICGVVFTYQKDDCEEYPFENQVKCPNCMQRLYHSEKNAVYVEVNDECDRNYGNYNDVEFMCVNFNYNRCSYIVCNQ